jgi:hypothetical protein
MDHTMKLSTLLLSSAALLVAGAAYAADLPAKKAAPAAAPTGCAAFGAGFFQIPGGDNCIKFSGRMLLDTTIIDPTKQGAVNNRTVSDYGMVGQFRLNTDVRSNTDVGVVRGFARLQQNAGDVMKLKYGYAQIGGFTAGFTDSAFISLNNPWGWVISTDDGTVVNAMQYTASFGGTTTGTIAIEKAADRANTADTGAAQVPDLVGNIKTVQGPVTFQVSAATHQNHGSVSNDKQGYAFQGAATFVASPATTLYLQAAYADSALSYLGYSINKVKDYTLTDASDNAKGWSLFGAVSQVAGSGTINFNAVYGIQTPNGGPDNKQTQFELNYVYGGIKGVQIIPAIYYVNTDNGAGTTTNATSGFLRIERDF